MARHYSARVNDAVIRWLNARVTGEAADVSVNFHNVLAWVDTGREALEHVVRTLGTACLYENRVREAQLALRDLMRARLDQLEPLVEAVVVEGGPTDMLLSTTGEVLAELAQAHPVDIRQVVRRLMLLSASTRATEQRRRAGCLLDFFSTSGPATARQVYHEILVGQNGASPFEKVATLKQLGKLFLSHPRGCGRSLSDVLSLRRDANAIVRQTVMAQLGLAISVRRTDLDSITDALLEGCQDMTINVKITALKQLGKALKACPHRASNIIRTFSNVASTHVAIEHAAVVLAPEMIASLPRVANEIIDWLVDRFAKADRRTRIALMSAAARSVALRSDRASELNRVLLKGFCLVQHDSVRVAATSNMAATIEGNPLLSGSVVNALSRAGSDESVQVRIAATKQYVRAAAATPSRASELAFALLRSCRDVDTQVRASAVGQLEDLAVSLPSYTREALYCTVMHGLGDEEDAVNETAKPLVYGLLLLDPTTAADLIASVIAERDQIVRPLRGTKRRSDDDEGPSERGETSRGAARKRRRGRRRN